MGVLHSVAVAAVIVNNAGDVLLTRRADNQQWDIPGGVLELDEDIITGLKREALEETGLIIDPVTLTGVYKNMTRKVVCLVFHCKPVDGALSLNEEVIGFHWASPSETTVMLNEAIGVRVTDALTAESPAVRCHDGVHLITEKK
jgi:8-oxo-dGTP diphosphatase